MIWQRLQSEEDNPEVVKQNEEWDLVDQVWKHLPIQFYSFQAICSKPSIKVLEYANRTGKSISFLIQSNLPKIVQLKNTAIILNKKDNKTNIRMQIFPPSTPCRLIAKLVIYDVKKGIPIEGIELEIRCKKLNNV